MTTMYSGGTMKYSKYGFIFLSIYLVAGVLSAAGTGTTSPKLKPIEELGKKLFFDTRLSEPEGQACAECHDPKAGWAGPDSKVNNTTGIYPGALHPLFGNRKPPTAAYAGMSPKLHLEEEDTFVGGMFWDGRATGWDVPH
ncbi:MAG: hypothetical protein GY757_61430, partial [bacterium]|nr:hypothetical protein [bacterium]